ncbi:MAG TPA: hypothetical protein VN858_07585 [Casimicrobiaceae bacterium]|nr:hypothetical protein [Casimicrobiaceae bacterium]
MTTRRQFLKGIGGSALFGANATAFGATPPPAQSDRSVPGEPHLPITSTARLPERSPPPAATADVAGFTLQRTGRKYAGFSDAEAAANDGDTILVAPATYTMQTNGIGTTKSITIRSAVPGKRYVLFVKRNAGGAIGNAFVANPFARFQAGITTRQSVALEDAEIFADGLTYQTGSCAVFLDCRGGCAADFAIRRCYIHDWDQGIESGNEYNATDRTSTITIEDSIVYQTGSIGSGDANHCIYVGLIGALSIKGSIVATKAKPEWTGPNIVNGSVDGPNYWPVGHLVKCRAKALTIQACRLTAEDTTVSNCIECSNGGDVLVTGSILEQGSRSDGNAFISYGRGFMATNPGGSHEIMSKDGRVNRLRVFQNTFVNSDARSGHLQQFVEISYQATPAAWNAAGAGPVPGDLTSAANQAIEGNVFVDSPANAGILPSSGYPGVGTQSGVLSVVGIPCTHAVNNTPKLTYGALVNVADRYAGWKLAKPISGNAAQAPFMLRDVAVASYAVSSPTAVARSDAQYGALRAALVPAWYAALPVNAWSHLPVTGVGQEVCSNANPKGIVWPSTGVVENYNASLPLVAGKHPIPGSSAETYCVFSGGRMIADLSFVQNGVASSGTYWLRYGGGHDASPDNSLHAIGPFDGTPKRIALTDPSIPPAIDLAIDGNPQANFASDGRPGAAHTYNSFAYLRSVNALVIGNGAGFNEGVGIYGFMFDTGEWLRNANWWDTSQVPGIDLCQEAAWLTDNVRNEVWIVPRLTRTPYVYRVSAPQGSVVTSEIVNGLETLWGSDGNVFYKKGWAIEGTPWLVITNEANLTDWLLIDRDARNQNGRLFPQFPRFVGDALPAPVDGGGNQPSAGAAFDSEEGCFYVWSAGGNPNTVASDVYKITPPGTQDLATQPWQVQRIAAAGGIAPEAPFGGLQWQQQNGQHNIGGWAPYGNFEFCPSPTRGLFFHHRLDIPPLFWRLA